MRLTSGFRPRRAPASGRAVARGWPALAARVLLAAGVAGCSVGPDYQRPTVPTTSTYREIKGWKLATPRDAEPKGPWWTVFRDPELDRLAAQVATNNQTVAAAEANYRQAQALVRQARAGLFPTVSLAAPLQRAGGSAGAVSQVGADITASWTLDIFGRAQRGVEAEEANARQTAADLANTTLLLQSALAQAYVQLRAAEAQTALMRRTVAEYRRSLGIIEDQYAAGAARKYDVIAQRTELLNAEATLIGFEGSRAVAQHAIALLVGRPPADLAIGRGPLGRTIPTPPLRLPSELLERRPDIAAAEEAMRRANAGIGLALTGYYPTVTLGGSAGLAGGSLGSLDPVWSIGLQLAKTLFNAGRTAAEVDAAREAYAAAVATYRGTILAAFKEVEDQLATLRILRQQRRLVAEQVDLARQSLAIAFEEYRAGAQTFDTVLTAQQTLLAAELTATQVRAQLMTATINLIVALGGGWEKPKEEATVQRGSAVPRT